MEVGEDDNLVGESRKGGNCLSRNKFPILAMVVVLIALGIVLAVVLSANLGNANNSWDDLMGTDNLMAHLNQFQNISTYYNGNRACNTMGYNSSVDYIVGQLQLHGYTPSIQYFTVHELQVNSMSNLTIASTISNFTFVYGVDFAVMSAVSIEQDFTQAPTFTVANYGCNATDYAGFPEGHVAVVKRGICSFADKAAAAEAFNPSLIIFYNEGNSASRVGLFAGSISGGTKPVLSTSYFVGLTMTQFPNALVTLSMNTTSVPQTTMNVIAETSTGRADSVIVVGSHLDSVPYGPGINDNGSGSSLNIELAIQLSSEPYKSQIVNKIRFAWWGAEELGLLGSNYYVAQLNSTNQTALYEIKVNLNFDMIGSPNFFRGIYNGTSDTENNGSGVVQRLFNDYYQSLNLPFAPTGFDGRSDYGPFMAVNIPAGGLFTGAEVVKSIPQRDDYGGLAGAPFDPCYHQSCDTIANINQIVYGQMAKGAAHVLQTLAIQEDLQTFLDTV